MKGLRDKWTVYIRSAEEQRKLGYFKADYAFDDEGRTWRRTYARTGRHGMWAKITPWHVADPYQWFPGDATPPAGARRANTRARLPKVDRYIGRDGQRIIDVREDRA